MKSPSVSLKHPIHMAQPKSSPVSQWRNKPDIHQPALSQEKQRLVYHFFVSELHERCWKEINRNVYLLEKALY